jgi:NADH-quinone oxidoreductase subunit M
MPILSLVTFLPLVGALLCLGIRRERVGALRGFALGVTVVTFLLSLHLWVTFDAASPGMQFEESVPWIPRFGIAYRMGIDGLSLPLVLLTTFLMPVSVLASFSITDKVKEYMACLLLLEAGMLGVFVALDLILFYVFWEGMLIPMYFLIGVWGGPRRIYATIKFFLYTMAGSVLMLLAMVGLAVLSRGGGGEFTFDLLTLYGVTVPRGTQTWLFLAFAVSFAIKVPMFPFHTWLPDAHVEAPTAGSVLLAGVLLKMGTYGFLRFAMPLFPDATREFVPLISWLAIVGILYGALVSMIQPDLKKLVAYSSVSHLGFVMLGLFALNVQGLAGGILQMVNHGLSTGALFLLVGIIYERRHSRMIADFGGLYRVMPAYGGIFLFVALSSLGLPGLNGFVGEFLILVGTFKADWRYAVLGTAGIVLAAVYLLWMVQRVMFGPLRHAELARLPDLTGRELATLLPICALILWIGVYPGPFLRRTEASVQALIQRVEGKRVAALAPPSGSPAGAGAGPAPRTGPGPGR